jgi:hypothetical protein
LRACQLCEVAVFHLALFDQGLLHIGQRLEHFDVEEACIGKVL